MTRLVTPISTRLATSLVVEHHYLHRRPPISHAYGLMVGLDIVGVLTLGVPPSRHLQVGACPSDPGMVLELNRLWVHDDQPRNTESWFMAQALRQTPARILVSYADTREGHLGFVYRASNWRYAGWTDMDRKTPRYDYLSADPTTHTRDAFRNGYVERRRRLPKIKYWTTTGTPAERRHLTALCGWPTMNWKTEPPPTEHQTRQETQ